MFTKAPLLPCANTSPAIQPPSALPLTNLMRSPHQRGLLKNWSVKKKELSCVYIYIHTYIYISGFKHSKILQVGGDDDSRTHGNMYHVFFDHATSMVYVHDKVFVIPTNTFLLPTHLHGLPCRSTIPLRMVSKATY